MDSDFETHPVGTVKALQAEIEKLKFPWNDLTSIDDLIADVQAIESFHQVTNQACREI